MGDTCPPADAARLQAPAYPDHTRLLVIRTTDGKEVPTTRTMDWEIRRAHILAHFMDVAGPLPANDRRVPLAVQVLETKDEAGYTRKKVQFASEPGDAVPAWLLVPEGRPDPSKRRPAIVCLHQTSSIGKDEPVGLGGKTDLAYAHELALRGYVVIAPDYPNFGEYHVDAYQLGYASATIKAVWNNQRAIDLLTSLPQVDPERIGIIGHSLVGHNAIFSALFEPRIKAVVSSCGFNAFPYYFGGNIAGWSHKGYMPRLRQRYALDLEAVPFDFPELIGALAPRALFVSAPLRDANFAVEGVRVCIKAARPVYDLFGAADRLVVAYPDAEHAFPRDIRERAYEFLDNQLKRGM